LTSLQSNTDRHIFMDHPIGNVVASWSDSVRVVLVTMT